MKELKDRNFSDDSINQLKSLLNIKGTNNEKIKSLRSLFSSNNISLSGVDLLEEIIKTSEKFNLNNINLDSDGFPIGFSNRMRESQTTSRDWNEYAFVRSRNHLDFVIVQ